MSTSLRTPNAFYSIFIYISFHDICISAECQSLKHPATAEFPFPINIHLGQQ